MRFKDKNLNVIVTKYFKYLKKRSKLILKNGHRGRRQIVEKQIKRLEKKLARFPHALQKGAIAAVIAGAIMCSPQVSEAQTSFGPAQINAFNIIPQSFDGYGNPEVTTSFADLDNDGDLDMMSGHYHSNFRYYENVGTATNPDFAAPVTNPFSLTNLGVLFLDTKPTLVDLDDDGDFDLFSGGVTVHYFENIGTPSSPLFGPKQQNPFSLNLAGGYAITDFEDFDNDGDLDILKGRFDGSFDRVENIGTASAPIFTTQVLNPYSLTQLDGGVSAPKLGDLDNDGDLDLISGSLYKGLYYMENIGSSTNANFDTPQLNPYGIDPFFGGPITSAFRISTPSLVDLDADGDLDIMSGVHLGNFYYFENTSSSPPPCDEIINDGFESGFGAWNDGGNDCARRSQFPNTGIKSVRLRDNSGVASSMTTDALDLTAYSELTFEFSYWPNSMENGEDFFLEVSTNNGSTFTIYKAWVKGTDFVNSVRYDEEIVIDNVTFTSQTKFRLRCDASGNGDQVFIDDVILTGCNSANGMNRIINDEFESSNTYELEKSEDEIFEETFEADNEKEFAAYPNPTRDFIYINGTWDGDSNEVQLMDIYGQKLLKKTINSGSDEVIKLDIAHLPHGIYIVNIIQSKELISTQKIMITN